MPFVSLSSPSTLVTANYTMTADDRIIEVNASAGPVTVTLVPVSTFRGLKVTIRKADATANAVTIQAAPGDTIDGAPSVTMSGQNDAFTLYAPLSGNRWVPFAGGVTLSSSTTVVAIVFQALSSGTILLALQYGERIA
jgi:hypothetical protein